MDGSKSGGGFYLVTDPSWSESTVTGDNAPAGDGYELDVTGFVTGAGPISFRAASTSQDGADYASKENFFNPAPQLVVEVS